MHHQLAEVRKSWEEQISATSMDNSLYFDNAMRTQSGKTAELTPMKKMEASEKDDRPAGSGSESRSGSSSPASPESSTKGLIREEDDKTMSSKLGKFMTGLSLTGGTKEKDTSTSKDTSSTSIPSVRIS